MRFRKSIKILPGIKVNLSKTGLSTTVGAKGLSVNAGKKGTYFNTGIPGTGIYNRQKILGNSGSQSNSNNQSFAGDSSPVFFINTDKSKVTTALLCFFFGLIGIHRFYTGHSLIGVLQIFTFGGFGLWVIIDFILIITGNFKDSNGNFLV
ncbi:DUF4236 domain-containing protein [Flavobacterium sp.]|uniref:DUF4236 domain-containing protein n=1 Tax=Flavobacterium sp. TaxID=239 RepID=UPI002BA90A7C|nr:DUF4236 domain-containing protein [Flavobacterium sp.]HSD07893.1 DUF4236 domain-containing protein [Flavobacterium sp.]